MDDGAVEVRVHGVSGTSPEALLDRPLVTQVAGDAIAGFYRPRLSMERRDEAPAPTAAKRADGPLLEGYNWGGLTSGSPGRALWLLLLPFTLMNVAPRARPDGDQVGGRPGRRTWWTWYLSRLLALSLTLLLVLTSAGISEDLVWWQCRRGQSCRGLPTWLATLLDQVAPGTSLLAAATVPALVLSVLWLISQRTLDRYEAVQVAALRGHATVERPDALEVTLKSSWMWRNQHQVRRLRAVHMQTGFALVVLVTSMSSRRGSAPNVDALHVTVTAVSLLVLAYGVVALAVPAFVGRTARPRLVVVSGVVWGLLLAVAVLQAALVVGRDVDGRSGAPGRVAGLPTYEATLQWLLFVMIALLVLLAAVVASSARGARVCTAPQSQHEPLAAGLRGCAAAYLAALAVLLAALFAAATYSYAAAWLHSGSLRPGPGEVADALAALTLPDTFRVATVAFLASVGCAAAVLTVAAIRTVKGYGPWGSRVAHVPEGALEADYGPDVSDPAQSGRRHSIERYVYQAALVDRVPTFLAWLVTLGVVILVLAAAPVLLGHLFGVDRARALLDDMTVPQPDGWRQWIGPAAQGWGAYLAVLSLLLAVSLAAAAFRVPATRRSVGILWDVASFWPRSCHPLAAPCYAERAVPDLVTRLHWHREGQRTVVLAAHSQGTVISAATVLRLSRSAPGDLDGIALLTFGCVLRRLYGRFFPAYFGPRQLAELQSVLSSDPEAPPRWLNLWRYTDYLGGQVTAGPPQRVPSVGAARPLGLVVAPPRAVGPTPWEWHDPDPPGFSRAPGSTVYPRPRRHSDFWSDESGNFQVAVAALGKTLIPLRTAGRE